MGYVGSVRALPTAVRWMLALLLVAVGLANVDQPFPDLAPLQHIPTVVLVFTAPLLLRRWPISTACVVALWVFMLLHTLAGRYIYSYVPYDAWLKACTGTTLSALTGWNRNGFDRLVHFSFGLLWTLPVRQAMVRRHGVDPKLALFIAFAFIGLVSAAYEIFEWLLTLLLAGDMANDYNGQQGDIWDTQKDMAMALIGSVLAMVWARVRRRG
jgi:putative membrane protein